ncbi:MAG: vancomycin high temperature exclusion protein [Chthoniobacteraceae bacterium]
MGRRLVVVGAIVVTLAVGTVGSGWLVESASQEKLYARVDQVPEREVGLLLGTTNLRRNGQPNPFFTHRIDAAVALYRAGKVRHLLVSGDNGTRGYDEPTLMRTALLAQGVPATAITLDYAGFRTLDSIVRAREVFGVTRFTVISQRFHDERALFIAQHYGLDAIAYCARDIGLRRGFKTKVRETFARVKAVLDLYVLHTRPKFLGPRLQIPLA